MAVCGLKCFLGRESRGERFRHSLVRLNCSDKVAETPSPQEFSPPPMYLDRDCLCLGGYFDSGHEVNDLGQLVHGQLGNIVGGDSGTLCPASHLAWRPARMRGPFWMSGKD